MKVNFIFIWILFACLFTNASQAQNDLSIASSMPDSVCLPGSIPVTVDILNIATIPFNSGPIDVSWEVDNGVWQTETISPSIASFGSYSFTFTNMVDVSSCGNHSFRFAVSYVGDTIPTNDTVSFDFFSVCLLNPFSVLGDTVCATPNQQLEVDAASTNGSPVILDWLTSMNNGANWNSQSVTTTTFIFPNPQLGSVAMAIFNGMGICPNDTVTIKLYPQPMFSFVSVGTGVVTVCSNRGNMDVIVQNANNSNDGVQYSTNGDGYFAQPLNDSTFYTFGPTDKANTNLWIYCESTVSPFCTHRDSIKVQWVVPPSGVISGDTAVCTGESLTLTASGAFTYFWYQNSGATSAGTQNPWTFIPTSNDTIVLFAIGLNSCADTVFYPITVVNLPIVQTIPDTSVCPKDVIQLITSGSNALSYNWSPSLGLNSTSVQSPFLTVQNSGSYVVTGTDAYGCSNSDSVYVDYVAGVNLDYFPDTIICPGSTIVLAANVSGNNILWSPNQTISGVNDPSPAVFPNQTTLYVVEVNSGVCSFSDSILVTIDGLGSTAIACDSFFCLGVEFVSFVTNSNFANYLWTVDGVFQSTGTTMNYQPQDVDSMVLECEISTPYNCVFSLSKIIKQGTEFQCGGEINNAFSPNGDGVNDVWVINILDGTTPNKVDIFTRYGDVLISIDNYDNVNNVWNGSNKSGKPMPSGVYFYTIDVEGQKISGWVNVSR